MTKDYEKENINIIIFIGNIIGNQFTDHYWIIVIKATFKQQILLKHNTASHKTHDFDNLTQFD